MGYQNKAPSLSEDGALSQALTSPRGRYSLHCPSRRLISKEPRGTLEWAPLCSRRESRVFVTQTDHVCPRKRIVWSRAASVEVHRLQSQGGSQ